MHRSLFLLYGSVASGTVLCNGCRPLSLLEGPGVGIDLALDYGTVAIHYRNGSVIDVAKINGSPAYRRAMLVMSEDADTVREVLPSMLTPIEYRAETPPYDPNYQDRVRREETFFFKLKRWYETVLDSPWKYLECPKCEPPPLEDPIVDSLAEMISSLTQKVQAMDPSVSEFVVVARPDFDFNSRAYHGRFALATNKAGLKSFGVNVDLLSSQSVLLSLGMMECHDPICEGEPRVLNLIYTNTTLATISMNSGSFYPCRTRYYDTLGADSRLRFSDPTQYWKDVKLAIEDSLEPVCDFWEPSKPTRFEQIVVVGERGNEREFLKLLQDMHGAMPRLQSTSGETHIFAGARGAAAQARRGMVDGFNVCLPNGWCAEAREDSSQREEL
ncbi:hypothetical protein EJ08DRAFT_682475 [Tothia fuscella]|uniref:Uncharacterized protein n=1 Tax=Tothia fuscella TaxID=1048955 RepID=A0A9P4NI70_9PEZI|nr:hypothetical protein EJ08DRAFT_682475 [Tothia fuscella]